MKKKENDKEEEVREEERELKDRRCFQCGDPGHVRRDCPEYRHLKQRAAAAASGVAQPPTQVTLTPPVLTLHPTFCLLPPQLTWSGTWGPPSPSPSPRHLQTVPEGPDSPLNVSVGSF